MSPDVTQNPFERLRQALEQERLKIESGEVAEKKVARSQRAELFKELYGYYEESYKQSMWVDYRKWLGRNRFKHNPARVAEFKKSKDFRKPIEIKSFCSYWLGFLKTQDLYYLISIAKDKKHRKENFNQWLFWSIKSKK